MVCPYCHREVADGTLYCIFCGKKLSEEAPKISFEQTQEKSDFDYEPTQKMPAVVKPPLPVNSHAAPMPAEITQLCCPDCGNRDFQVVMKNNTTTTVNTKTKGYSASKGCLGYMFAGPLGLLCGACGSGKSESTATTTVTNEKSFVCKNCGCEFRSPKDLEGEIAALEASLPTERLLGKVSVGISVFLTLICLITICLQEDNFFHWSLFAYVITILDASIGTVLLITGIYFLGNGSKNIINNKKAEYQDLKERMARFQ